MIEKIQFSSFSEFLDMGGYAFNVWSVYFLFAIFISINLISPIRKRKQIMRDLERRVTMSSLKNGGTIDAGDVSNSEAVGETQ